MSQIKITFPTNDELMFINSYCANRANELIEMGLLSQDAIETWAIGNNIFEKELLKTIENLESEPEFRYRKIVTDTKVELDRFLELKILEIILGYRIINKNYIGKDYLSSLPKIQEYAKLTNQRYGIVKTSYEQLVENEKRVLLTYFCCKDAETGNRLWESLEQLMCEKITPELKFLMREVSSFLGGINNSIVRYIARNSMWRTKWISATKTSAALFRGEVADWDINKTMLCYWSNFYDNVYSSYESPEEFIVKDDELLDNWLESRNSRSKQGSSNDGDTHKGIFKTRINPVKRK